MNTDAAEPTSPETAVPDAETPATRRRRAKAPVAEATQHAGEGAAAAKPKRRRAGASAEESAAEAAVEAAGEAAGEVMPAPKPRRTGRKAERPAGETAGEQRAGEAQSVQAGAVASALSDAEAPAVDSAALGASDSVPDQRPRRRRSPRGPGDAADQHAGTDEPRASEAFAEPQRASEPGGNETRAAAPAIPSEPDRASIETAPEAMPPFEATAARDGDTESAGNFSPRPPGTGRNRRRRGPRDSTVADGRSAEPAPGEALAASSATEARPPFAASFAISAEASAPAEPPVEAHEVFAQVVSGEFDAATAEAAEAPASAEAPAVPPYKRVLRPEPDAPKLHKVLAQAGVGSRRDMEQLIAEGLITVNGQPAHTGQRISFGDQVAVRGKPVKLRIVAPPPRLIAYHKPVGEVVTYDDPQQRPTVFRRLPRLQQGKWQAVGRLDINTEGLLLFTTSGELANQLMHPRFGVEREYAVRVLGVLSDDDKAQLLEGVDIDGQTAAFRSIEEGGGEGANRWYRVVIAEGRNREVRKLFAAVGATVSRLIRIRYGCIVLPRGLRRGVWVDLADDDVRAVRRLAGGGEARPSAPSQQQALGPKGKNRNRNKRDLPPGARSPGGEPRYPERVAAAPRDDDGMEDDFDPARIPNPLEQTFDKRFVQNPRTPAGGRGFGRGGGGFGAGGSAPPPQKKGGPHEPDPLQTSVGYIGADAFHRKGTGPGAPRGGNRGGGFGRGGSRGR